MNPCLIWSNGRIFPLSELLIPASDRTFEHGLGLFETFRTWNGHAPTLGLHLGRLRDSAAFWGITLNESSLPDLAALLALKCAEHYAGDVVFRLTVSGGNDSGSPAMAWLRARSLPPLLPLEGLTVIISNQITDENNPIARHKSLNYLNRRMAYDEAIKQEAHESLFLSAEGNVWEGSRSNLFAIQGNQLITPPLTGPILPGVMRDLVLRLCPLAGLECIENPIKLMDLFALDEVFLTNALRGIMPVANIGLKHWKAPGPRTWTLTRMIYAQLNSEQDRQWDKSPSPT